MNPDAPLTIDTLGDLDDGYFRELVQTALNEAIRDCDQRPGLKKARKVVITLDLAGVEGDRGETRGIEVDPKVEIRLPARTARQSYLRVNHRGDHVEALHPNSQPSPLFIPDDTPGTEPS